MYSRLIKVWAHRYGLLYERKMARAMPPYQGGGEMIGHVTFEKTTFNELPFKFEAGTPDYIGTMAFARAIDYIDSLGIENIAAHEDDLLRYTTRKLTDEIDGHTHLRDCSRKMRCHLVSCQGHTPLRHGYVTRQVGICSAIGTPLCTTAHGKIWYRRDVTGIFCRI